MVGLPEGVVSLRERLPTLLHHKGHDVRVHALIQVVGPASDVADFQDYLSRQLPLDAEVDLVVGAGPPVVV